jgi:NADH dehydrogenase (ubiquinone) Fe-S protein 6
MFSSTRSRLFPVTVRASRLVPHANYGSSRPPLPENPVPANDPNPPKLVPNVSETNAVPLDSMGGRDEPLQESPQQGEHIRHLQAPNRATTWSRSQRHRHEAMTGPRFEQTIMEYQVRFFG